MIPSLYIKNYKNLDGLAIDSFSRVNLLTGKNNTGKSSLLEAIAIYANSGSLSSIIEILINRGEYPDKKIENEDIYKFNLKALASIFKNRQIPTDIDFTISIDTKSSNNNQDIDNLGKIALSFYKFDTESTGIDGKNNTIHPQLLALRIDTPLKPDIIPLTQNLHFFVSPQVINNQKLKSFFVKSNDFDKDYSYLWDKIALTDNEKYIVEALQIIEKNIERVTFVNDEFSNKRHCVVKLKNSNEVVPLRSMGDGLNRILNIILAMVNCSDGYLLIDEFENGLHYSVQEKLWEVIFKLAKDLNIQVFATTHSEDCIRAFGKISNIDKNKNLGKMIRLEKKKDKIVTVDYLPDEIKIATENNIETR